MVVRILSVLGFSFCMASFGAESTWESQVKHARTYLLENISPEEAAKGAVVAATSKEKPEYFFHWIRDAGLVMGVVVDLYRSATRAEEKAQYERILLDYLRFSELNQTTPNPSGGLGEPKFYPDGTAFTGSWGRPQNDGPALRALALIKLAEQWIREGNVGKVRRLIYDGASPSQSVLKVDLEFVAKTWRDTCFDIWEEVKGHHYYTRLAQGVALDRGARLAEQLGDFGAARFYRGQAFGVMSQLEKHWDAALGVLVPTTNRDGGIEYKKSGIDTSVILAAMHMDRETGPFSLTDEKVLATLEKAAATFQRIYGINHQGLPAIAIGRYPEDMYDGYKTGQKGNPWVLTTLGFGEALYRIAGVFERAGSAKVTAINRDFFVRFGGVSEKPAYEVKEVALAALVRKMRATARTFLDRVRYHSAKAGRLSEQMDRETGHQRGAENLTWSYAAVLTAEAASRPRE